MRLIQVLALLLILLKMSFSYDVKMPLIIAAIFYLVKEIMIGMKINTNPIFPTNINAILKHLPYDQFENAEEFKLLSFLSFVKILKCGF